MRTQSEKELRTMTMDAQTVIQELEALGKERLKKMYMSNGAREPLFGVATGAMKPLFRKIKINHELAEELYRSGNYDVMYFAGMIADPHAMTAADFERWIDAAYFYMLSDFVVAVTLSESPLAQEVSDQWIASDNELKQSAGWSCYCWLLGNRPDHEFSEEKIASMLKLAEQNIHQAEPRVKSSMNNFLYTAGVSYLPLHDLAIETAKRVGQVELINHKGQRKLLNALEDIQKAIDKGRIGFKRKYVRC